MSSLVAVGPNGTVELPANFSIPVGNITGLIENGKIVSSLLPTVTVSDVQGLLLGNTEQIDPVLIPTITKDKLSWLFSGDTINPIYLPAFSGGSGGPNFTQDVSIFEHSLGVGGAAGEWSIALYDAIGKKRGINLGNGIAIDATVAGKITIYGQLALGAVKASSLSIAGLGGGLPLMYDSVADKIIESPIKYTGAPQAIHIPHVYITPTSGTPGDRRLMWTTPLADFREKTIHMMAFFSNDVAKNLDGQYLLASLQNGDAGRNSELTPWTLYVRSDGKLVFWPLGSSEQMLGAVPLDRWHWFSMAFVKKNFLNWEIWVYLDGYFFTKILVDRPEQVGSLGPMTSSEQLAVGRVVVTDTPYLSSVTEPQFGQIVNGLSDGASNILFNSSTMQTAKIWLSTAAGWSLQSSLDVLQNKA